MRTEQHLSSSEVLAAALTTPSRERSDRSRLRRACTACRADIEDFRVLRRALTRRVEEPAESVVLRATALMAPVPARTPLEPFQVARLLHDSARLESEAQVRGPAASRHQLWRTTHADIDVRLEGPSLGAEGSLIGQLLPHRVGVGRGEGNAWLREGKRARWTPISASGEFFLPMPTGRRWTILLEWGLVRARIRMP